jgi:hypothetical protein
VVGRRPRGRGPEECNLEIPVEDRSRRGMWGRRGVRERRLCHLFEELRLEVCGNSL